jgi:hypothetical protein
VSVQIVRTDGTIVKVLNANAAAGNILSLNIEQLTKGVYVLQVRDASSNTNVPFVKM